MNETTTPVLIGVGQFTDRSNSKNGLAPTQMMAEASKIAATDTASSIILQHVDVIAAAGLTVDAAQVKNPLSGLVRNVPRAVAKHLGISPSRFVYAETGGDTPQKMVNHFAKEIALGKCETVLLTGGESFQTMRLKFSHWSSLFRPKGAWKDRSGSKPESLGDVRLGSTDYEDRYGMSIPSNVYPLFENAIRAQQQRDLKEHAEHIAKMFSAFSKVAAINPHAWLPRERTAQELLTPEPPNRMVAYPYTKWLNSMLFVNQSAAVILTSVAKAKSLGVPMDRLVFLHGAASGNDIWNVSQRHNFHSSVAMCKLGRSALTMAGKDIDDIAAFDLYSCFPSAVQVACDALGVVHDDPRGLTLTGGMPYFGGPGNNYNMHGIAEMVNWARNNPNEFGLVNANGWYLTKHAFGIYSATPPKTDFNQAEFGSQDIVDVNTTGIQLNEGLYGPAKIETYTVLFDKSNQPQKAIIVARDDNNNRCLANTDEAPEIFERLLANEAVGRRGELVKRGNLTLFDF